MPLLSALALASTRPVHQQLDRQQEQSQCVVKMLMREVKAMSGWKTAYAEGVAALRAQNVLDAKERYMEAKKLMQTLAGRFNVTDTALKGSLTRKIATEVAPDWQGNKRQHAKSRAKPGLAQSRAGKFVRAKAETSGQVSSEAAPSVVDDQGGKVDTAAAETANGEVDTAAAETANGGSGSTVSRRAAGTSWIALFDRAVCDFWESFGLVADDENA